MATELKPPSVDSTWRLGRGQIPRPRTAAWLVQNLIERILGAIRARAAPSRRASQFAELLRLTHCEAQAARRASADCERALAALSTEVAALHERVRMLEVSAATADRTAPRPAQVLVRARTSGRLWGSVRGLARDDTAWIPLFAVAVAAIALSVTLALSTVAPSAPGSAAAPTSTLAPTASEIADPAPLTGAILHQTDPPAAAAPAAPTAAAEPTAPPSATPTSLPNPTPAIPRSTIQSGGSGARLRAEPGTDAAVLEVLADGAEVGELESEILVAGRSWRHVEAPSGKVGWIDRELLRTAALPR